MIKHADVLKFINSGSPFSLTYVTKKGELSIFENAYKQLEKSATSVGITEKSEKRREGNSYNSLIPVTTANGELRELYTRGIIKFNGEEVVL